MAAYLNGNGHPANDKENAFDISKETKGMNAFLFPEIPKQICVVKNGQFKLHKIDSVN